MSSRDWDASIYDRVSDLQETWARAVLGRLPLRGDETVLDAGCGSGRVTRLLLAGVAWGDSVRQLGRGKCELQIVLDDLPQRHVPWKAAAMPVDGADWWQQRTVPSKRTPTAVGVRDGMTISLPAQSPQQRRTARIAGVWFVITFVASIPALLLYDPVLNDTGYITGGGGDTRVQLGALLEVITAIAGIATAVVLFPIVKRQSESIALGYVATRVLESTIIVVGLISLLAVVTLRQELAGAAGSDPAVLETVGRSLVAIKDWTFLFGPAFCAGLGNGLLLGYLMYRSGLVPRRMALLGVIGGPVSVVGATFVLFGAWEQTSSTQGILTLGEIAWEASLGIYLIVKGFRPSPILDDARYAGGDGGSPRPAAAAP